LRYQCPSNQENKHRYVRHRCLRL